MKPCDKIIEKTLDLADEMLRLSDEGDSVREDTNCGVIYAVLRDSAYRIRKLAEAEKRAHIKKGWWRQERSRGKDGRT